MSGAWQASVIALWAFSLFVGFLLVGVLRQLGLINLRLGPDQGALLITDVGLERGVEAPDFEVFDARSKEHVHLHDLPGVPRVLAFVSPSCASCEALLRGLNEVMAATKGDYDFLVICRGIGESCTGLADMTGLTARIVVDPTGSAHETYGVSMTPFLYLIDGAGRVLIRGIANDWRGVESLLTEEGTIQTQPWHDVSSSAVPREEVKIDA